MPCWNTLSIAQQDRLIGVGTLPMGYRPEGGQRAGCRGGAECCVETMDDEAGGPRFYCYPCAKIVLAALASLKVMGGNE